MGSCVSRYNSEVKQDLVRTPPPRRSPAPKQAPTCKQPDEETGHAKNCSPTYTNLGVFRASITPLKHPRNLKSTTGLSMSAEALQPEAQSVPPPLPRKAAYVPSAEPLSLSKGGAVCGEPAGSADMAVLNPLYTLSSGSAPSLDSHGHSPLNSLPTGRPANSLSCLLSPDSAQAGRDTRGFYSTECLLGRDAAQAHTQPLYRGIDSSQETAARIRSLHRDMLRKLTCRCEQRFTASHNETLNFGPENWSRFKLSSNKPCCEAGDAVYYSASYGSETHNTYAIKVLKVNQSQQQLLHSLPPHFNIQQDCGRFQAALPAALLQHSNPSETERCLVEVVRPVPTLTAADFVREGEARHTRDPGLYERQVCVLLLQLCHGLEHMKLHQVSHCDLRLENLLLVPYDPTRNIHTELGSSPCPARLLISNFTQARIRSVGTGTAQSRVAPEVLNASQYSKSDEFQTGILIYEMLHQSNPFEAAPGLSGRSYRCSDLPRLPPRSLYTHGLQKLSALLLSARPAERLHVSAARAALQCLLWGPRDEVFQALAADRRAAHSQTVLHNWLELKQALMMIKFAERSLESTGGVSLEDWLCAQYVAFTTPDMLTQTIRIFQQASTAGQQEHD